jgi:hypothetical protein
MFTTEIRVGRLYEHRLGTLSSEAELAALRERGLSIMQASPRPVVVCADYRGVKFVKAELVTPFIEFLRKTSPKVERSAVLLAPDHAIFTLQMTRMVREANFPQRRTFNVPRDLETWLAEVLTVEERARLAAFISEPLPEA